MYETPATPFLSSIVGFAITLFFLLGFYMVRKREEGGWLMGLALGAFLLKAILVPIYFQWLVSVGDFGFAHLDASEVHLAAIQMVNDIDYDTPRGSGGWAALDPGFFIITAYVYQIFGPNTLIIRFFLIMCVSISLVYIYRITRLYFDEKTARTAAVLQAFLPLPILLSLNHRKDPLIQLIALFIFYHAVRIFRQEPGWQRATAMVVMGLFAIYPFRSGMVLPFLAVMVLCFVLANRNLLQGIALSILTIVGLLISQVTATEDSRINLDRYWARAENKLDMSAQLSEEGSGLVRLLRVTGPTDIYKVPFAAVAYLILPFPPNFDQGPQLILESILNLVSIFLLPHLLLGAWSMIRGPDWRLQLPLLIFPIFFLLLLGAVHIGLVRYKQLFYPICLIWTAVGWQRGTGFLFKFSIYGILGLFGAAIYLYRFVN